MKVKYIFYSLIMVFIIACDDKLEIDPQQSLSTDQAFSDALSSKGSLMGVYSTLQDFDVYGSLPQVIADFQSDNVNFIGTFPTLQDISRFSSLSTNSSVQTLWRDHYVSIGAANAVIANIPGVDDPAFAEEDKQQYVAEARFLRALLHFQLVNLFAHPVQVAGGESPGIPIVTEPYTGEVSFPERSSVNQVHEFIRTELEEIIAPLPDSYATAAETRGRATKGAARALLSRLHLYRGEWQLAANYAAEVIGSEVYTLATDFGFYNANTPEDIFTIQNSATDNGATGSGGWASYYVPAPTGRGDAPFSQYLIDAYMEEPGDLRFTELTLEDGDQLYTTKFPDAVNNSDNAPVLRVTEMYLNRAEALAELNGINDESLELINDLRDRAGLSVVEEEDFSGPAEFLEAIREERRKELAFEGHRRMDLLRTGQALRPAGDAFFEASKLGEDKTILPIPQRERDVNTGLSQNDGY